MNETTLSCNVTTNVTGNLSLCPFPVPTTALVPRVNPYDEFFKFAFGSAIYLINVSLISMVANGLLLAVLFFDPLKILRTATTYFLIGLALVDLLLAATQEAMYATCFIMMFLRHPATLATCTLLLNVGWNMLVAAMNASLLIVLAFTVTQYTVVISPLRYARSVTKTRVKICVLLIYVYTRFFILLQEMGVSVIVLAHINVILHLFIVPNLTIIFYVLLYKAFKKQMSASENLREGNNVQNRDRHTTLERKFIIMNFLLIAILFLCCDPIVILWAVRWFSNGFNPSSPKALIAYLMLENVLYLKLLLDPFVLVWRVPKYRQALKIVLHCGREAPKTTLSHRVPARMNKSRAL